MSAPKQIAALIVLLLPALLVSMDISILFVANPAIARDLAPTASAWLWMMDSYSLVVAALLVTMGSLADRIGRRRLLLIGGVAFGLASLLLALASTPALFILGRVLLGIGAATLAPSTLAIIRSVFTDLAARRRAVSAWTISYTGGAVAGPVLGGFLLSMFDWPAVFLINLPVMALLLVAGPFLLPESRDPQGAHFDLPGAALSLLALFGIVYAVKSFTDQGMGPVAWGSLVLGLGLLVAFVLRQRRAAHPLIDLSLFTRGAFTGAVAANVLAALGMVGIGALAFTYLQSAHDLSALQAALYTLPTFLGTAVGATLASELAKRIRPAFLVAAGMALTAGGMVFIGLVAAERSPVWFIGGYIVLTLGAGGVSALANSLVLATAPASRTGAAASISETGVQLGAALGIAGFGLVSTAFYRAEMVGVPGSVPPAMSESMAGAEAAAADLPAHQAGPLLEMAAQAFASSMGSVAFVIAGVMALAAVLTGVLLRSVPAGAEAEAEEGAETAEGQ